MFVRSKRFLCTPVVLEGIKETNKTLCETIKNLISHGYFFDALTVYQKLHLSGFHRNAFILPSLLKACACLQYLVFGLQLHCHILKTGHSSETATGNSLITMYVKCSSPDAAFQVFVSMPERDIISWNAMISGYAQSGKCIQATQLFVQMKELDIEPNSVTWSLLMAGHAHNGHVDDVLKLFRRFVASGLRPSFDIAVTILSVCSQTCNLMLGKETHASIIRNESGLTVFSAAALIDMYSKCYDFNASFKLFERVTDKNEVCWTAVIAACAMNKYPDKALYLFHHMRMAGVELNRVTFLTVVPACAALSMGKEIHGLIVQHGLESDNQIMSALLDMHLKCGDVQLAELIFRKFNSPDIVVWSSLINGFSYNGDYIKAMRLFLEMRKLGVSPNHVTILAFLSACSSLSALHQGRGIHAYAIKSSIISWVYVCNALIDMYAKCGCLEASHQVFGEILDPDSVSWSSLVYSYGIHGYGESALKHFDRMQKAGFKPDPMAFLAALSACKHSGLVEEGIELFTVMINDHEIVPKVEHYACFIDLLARSGKLVEAFKIMKSVSPKQTPCAWGLLLSACRLHGESKLAEKLLFQILEAEPDNAANYALLSSMYAETGDRLGAEKLWKLMRKRGLKKQPACSWVESSYQV